MTAAPAASALREQVARALAQCHGDQWAESEGEPVEGYGERFAFAWQAEADKCIALIRPAVLREAAALCQTSENFNETIGKLTDDPVFGINIPSIIRRELRHVERALLALADEAEASAEAGRETGV